MKPTIFQGAQRERLLITLLMNDMTAAINAVMRIRQVAFTLDYAQDHFPRLLMQCAGTPLQTVMTLDQRKHRCFITPPTDRLLYSAFEDITVRLGKLGGRLSLTGDSPREGKKRCLLQVYVDGANRFALTLMDVRKGQSKRDVAFQLPDGTTP